MCDVNPFSMAIILHFAQYSQDIAQVDKWKCASIVWQQNQPVFHSTLGPSF